MKKAILFVLLCSFFFSPYLGAQQDSQKETDANVPQLEKFHEIMYPIWHTAYPEKDYKTLKEYAPKVKELAEEIYAAPLPGILRDKQEKWNKSIEEFKTAVSNYQDAASGNDNDNMLASAEELHTKYENLVRIIKPVTKEVGEFHQSLYVIYHSYLPNKDYAAIKAISGELAAKAENITFAKLSKRLESKKTEFDMAARNLLNSCAALNEASINESDHSIIEKAIEKVHADYVTLECVFE